MNINYNGKQVEVKYTYNSFKFMREVDFAILNEIDRFPFKLFDLAESLLYGGLNHDRKVRYIADDVDAILEEVSEKGDLMEFVEGMIEELEKSGFFKSLHRQEDEQEVK